MPSWKQIDEIFRAAVERPPEDRGAFLEEVCGGDEKLLREVESLLAADARGDGDTLLHAAVEAEAAKLEKEQQERAGSRVGQQIGPYRLFREIGRGGMGAVYLAGRADDEFRRQVAIKVVQSGLDREGILRRFRNERQILAGFDHPHVARLLDGGTTGDGLPYFVMEYIEGEPLDRYCDRHRLSVEERIELFRSVCLAVHYAHQNLVVHRDLKPGNILVTPGGVPKLLDFGVAKLLNPELAAQTIYATGIDRLRLMTPAYASPEQVRGGPITTASDVYSLGVLLYELLTGHRPYRVESSTPQEIERAVCDTEPAKPSTVVRRVETTGEGETLSPETVSRLRGGRPEALQRRLAGDLDNIVLMAMRKEPQRRYASAEQLAEDLRRHLTGLPVRARPDIFTYRAAKFVGRHKVGVAFLAVLLLFAVGMTVLSFRLAAERNRAEAERERAERERATTDKVSGLLVDLFHAYHPERARGEEVTARALLDQGAEGIEEELRDEPEVQAELMLNLARAYKGLAAFAEAETMFAKGLAAARRAYGDQHPKVAEAMNDLGMSRFDQGDIEGGEGLVRGALAMRRRLLAEDHLQVAESRNDLARILRDRGAYEEAEELYRQALAVVRQQGEPWRHLVPWVTNNLAITLVLQGQPQEAELMIRGAMEDYRRLRGPDHPEVAFFFHSLAAARRAQGFLEEAEELLRRSLSLRRATLDPLHPEIAWTLTVLASVEVELGDPEEAEALGREALEILDATQPEGHWRSRYAEAVLAACRTSLGRYEEAERLLTESYPVLNRRTGAHSPYTQEALRYLVQLYEAWGKPEAAAGYGRLRQSGGG